MFYSNNFIDTPPIRIGCCFKEGAEAPYRGLPSKKRGGALKISFILVQDILSRAKTRDKVLGVLIRFSKKGKGEGQD
jgi:hypothetical protein